jgi:hypothetical protein
MCAKFVSGSHKLHFNLAFAVTELFRYFLDTIAEEITSDKNSSIGSGKRTQKFAYYLCELIFLDSFNDIAAVGDTFG